jgi:hypothetical protein
LFASFDALQNSGIVCPTGIVLRHSRFPTIPGPYEIAREIRQEAEIRANTERLWKIDN